MRTGSHPTKNCISHPKITLTGLRSQLSICPNCSKKYAPKKASKNRGWRRAKPLGSARSGPHALELIISSLDNWKRKPAEAFMISVDCQSSTNNSDQLLGEPPHIVEDNPRCYSCCVCVCVCVCDLPPNPNDADASKPTIL